MTGATYPSLRDRGVLITGGATGIGACLVEHFAAQGANVGFIDIDGATGGLARALGGRVHAPVFVRCRPAPTRGAASPRSSAVRQRFGPVTVLLNNAANDHAPLDRGRRRPRPGTRASRSTSSTSSSRAQAVAADMKRRAADRS